MKHPVMNYSSQLLLPIALVFLALGGRAHGQENGQETPPPAEPWLDSLEQLIQSAPDAQTRNDLQDLGAVLRFLAPAFEEVTSKVIKAIEAEGVVPFSSGDSSRYTRSLFRSVDAVARTKVMLTSLAGRASQADIAATTGLGETLFGAMEDASTVYDSLSPEARILVGSFLPREEARRLIGTGEVSSSKTIESLARLEELQAPDPEPALPGTPPLPETSRPE